MGETEILQGAGLHVPVLLAEAVDALNVSVNGAYIDATFGRGGHSKKILEKLSESGKLLALDQDLEAVKFAKKNFNYSNFNVQHGSFTDIENYVLNFNLKSKVSGILLDLGVSSPQLDDSHRGFSFMREGPLDMRMNMQSGVSAKQWLQEVSEEGLKKVLQDYGEERFAGRIARRIKEAINVKELNTTLDLADLVKEISPKKEKNKHPATRTFQAIRIAVNRELESLHSGLEAALRVLSPGGRLAVISFHSLEDRIVKQFMKKKSKYLDLYPESPVELTGIDPVLKIIGKPVFPTKLEKQKNIRSRSAVLRISEKL